MQAYIIDGYRSAIGKGFKGGFRFTRPDDLAIHIIKHLISKYPEIDKNKIDDVITGCAVPEAEQSLNMGRMIALGALSLDVPGMTINRYCGSGLESIVIGLLKIQAGLADCIIAGGSESMTMVPLPSWKAVINTNLVSEHPDWFYNMGITAEEVAGDYKINREDQDEFAYHSHQKALKALETGNFKDEIVPVVVKGKFYENGKIVEKSYIVDMDEGPRKDTSKEALAKLKPVFKNNGTVTAGNSSQTSDGAAYVLLMSEKMMKELKLQPKARLVSHAVAGVDPRIMGVGPIAAIPKVLKLSGLKANEVDQIELNEAFASQSLAVIRELDLDPGRINMNGGAIALGHPLGCTGTVLTIKMLNDMKRRKQKYGMVTMCIGGGQGAAGIFELL